ncbi:Septum-promoting gtp-binding protein 1, partial [Globisporangium splendens]
MEETGDSSSGSDVREQRVETPSRGLDAPGPNVGSGRNNVVVKVGMVGDAQVGKTSLMVKYVEGKFDEDYIHTLGHREFISMLPLVCNDAVAILFMFDLSRKATLTSVKEWYRQVRSINKNAFPFLIGMKYDHFTNFSMEEQEDITKQAFVWLIIHPLFEGAQVRQGHEGAAHFHVGVALDQHPEALQSRAE